MKTATVLVLLALITVELDMACAQRSSPWGKCAKGTQVENRVGPKTTRAHLPQGKAMCPLVGSNSFPLT